MLGRVDGLEDVLEVARARAQDNPVRLHRVPLARQGHVGEVNILPEHNIAVVIIVIYVLLENQQRKDGSRGQKRET